MVAKVGGNVRETAGDESRAKDSPQARMVFTFLKRYLKKINKKHL